MKLNQKIILASAVSMLAINVSAANGLADVRNVYVEYTEEGEVEGCYEAFLHSLKGERVPTVENAAQADATLKVKVAVDEGGLRPALEWSGVLVDKQGRELFEDDGNDGGWSLLGACEDAADNMAEDLGEAIEDADD